MMRRLAIACGLAMMGCAGRQNFYAPAEARRPIEGAAAELGAVVAMYEPAADLHIAGGVDHLVQAGQWRWTGRRPTLRFRVANAEGARLVMDFAIAATTFAQTGPVTVSFLVNDRLLDRVRYDAPGEEHLEKPVPPGWLRPGSDNFVVAELDRVFVSPKDGAELGLILSRAGFVR